MAARVFFYRIGSRNDDTPFVDHSGYWRGPYVVNYRSRRYVEMSPVITQLSVCAPLNHF